MQITLARVLEKRLLTHQLTKLILAPRPYIPYLAGQYLQLVRAESSNPYSYSIANAPTAAQTYELHIRHGIENTGNQQLIASINLGSELTLELPFGECTLEALDPQLPILFIAGGTGFAPIKAMLEQLQLNNSSQITTLIWRAKNQQELYLDSLVKDWLYKRPNFHYIPQLERDSIKNILASHPTHPQLSAWQIVLAGPFDMVYNIRDELINAGVAKTRLHSDAFAYEHTT